MSVVELANGLKKNRGQFSRPVADEWQDQMEIVDEFRQTRKSIDCALDKNLANLSELFGRICDCIRAPARRIPLTANEVIAAQRKLSAMQAAAEKNDPNAYCYALAGALLYLTPPEIDLIHPELYLPWIVPAIAVALQGGALISIGDDEIATLRAMDWCIRFAKYMRASYENGTLAGGRSTWNSLWLPILGFDITALPFYSSTFSLKKFVELFGHLRAEAFAASPPNVDGRKLRVIGNLQRASERDRRKRIALFCSHPTAHGHGLPHFVWWMACIDRTQFEPVLVLRETQENAPFLENFLHQYACLQEYSPIVITSDNTLLELKQFNFDLLYNFDDQCQGRSERPAYLRLAKHQVTAFYTPATTGCTEMDYFITTPELDPITEDEFTEKVVLSEGLPFCFHYASYFGSVSSIEWSENDIPQDAVIYTMGASMLTKLRPGFVDALLEIMKRTPNSICIAMPSARPKDRVHLTEYIMRKCNEAGIAPNRFRFYGATSRSLLHSLIKQSHVFLDFFPFSGTNNILDPLVVGTPCVVLCPPGFSRNRIAASIMRSLEMHDLIACTIAEYVELAVKLGSNAELRESIRLRLGAQRVENSPLCNGEAFVARMESIMNAIMGISLKGGAS